MKTLLLPVDFTESSANVIDFAARWCLDYQYERIILLKSSYTSMYENVIMAGEFANVDEQYLNRDRQIQKDRLDNLCKELSAKAGGHIQVCSAISELPLLRSILEVVKQEHPVMVMLGSDNIPVDNQALVSANVIAIAKTSPVRVLIVPRGYLYRRVERALVPFHFNTLRSLDKLNTLHASPRWKEVKLFVLNVDKQPRNLKRDTAFSEAEQGLHNYLKDFHHEIFYEANSNVISGILEFEKNNDVQLVIALPGVHSFLYSLTHKSVSEALYKNCKVPVMILK